MRPSQQPNRGSFIFNAHLERSVAASLMAGRGKKKHAESAFPIGARTSSQLVDRTNVAEKTAVHPREIRSKETVSIAFNYDTPPVAQGGPVQSTGPMVDNKNGKPTI